MKNKIIAHRGIFNNIDIPENSMKAFEKALKLDYPIELDVQLTKDNVLVVLHDLSLKRMTGNSLILQELTYDEIPHSITCYVEEYEEKKDLVHIQVVIVVDRENIKKMVIGKKGAKLKEIGIRARKDMENFLGKKVFLETYVKTIKNWREEEKYFLELGLKEEE